MTSNFDVPLDVSVTVLKQVLPLMSRQRVPAIPENYAVWYDYVTHANDELAQDIKARIDAGSEFEPPECQEIYEKYFADQTIAGVEDIHSAVKAAVESVLGELEDLGTDISNFSSVLSSSGDSLAGDPTKEELNRLLKELVHETARTKSRSEEVEGSLQAMAEELVELRSQVDQLSKDSLTDALTGVPNRRAFDQGMQRMMAEATAQGSSLCLIILDIDHFKRYNDTHGHVVGDLVLRSVAQELDQCVKGRDLLARYGGEEFAILLPATPLAGAKMLAGSIRSIIETHRSTDAKGEALEKVTVSLGVANFKSGENAKAFIERADACLYKSKERGRNRVTTEEELQAH